MWKYGMQILFYFEVWVRLKYHFELTNISSRINSNLACIKTDISFTCIPNFTMKHFAWANSKSMCNLPSLSKLILTVPSYVNSNLYAAIKSCQAYSRVSWLQVETTVSGTTSVPIIRVMM
jgi:hypothetical protein